LAPFCCSLADAWRLSACILTPDTKSRVQARGRRMEGSGAGGAKPCAISSSAAHANAQANASVGLRVGMRALLQLAATVPEHILYNFASEINNLIGRYKHTGWVLHHPGVLGSIPNSY
jgi:hypothetical protein